MYQPPDRRSKLSGSNAQALNVVRLRVLEGPNVRDQIAFYACHSFLESKRMLATYLRRMRKSNLEIRTAGSSGRPQL